MTEFTLYHPEHGYYTSDNSILIDRKLSIGYKFLDEIDELKNESSILPIKKFRKKRKTKEADHELIDERNLSSMIELGDING